MKVTEILSDNEPCEIRVLGLFELDPLAPAEAPGDFMEEIDIGGKVTLKKYIPPDTPPEEPEVQFSDVREGSQLWHDWEEYRLWLGFIEHRRREAKIISRYATRVKDYILKKCISKKDIKRVIYDSDWLAIHRAALSARLKEEDLAQALAGTFPGEI